MVLKVCDIEPTLFCPQTKYFLQAKDTSEEIIRVLNQHNIKVAHKPICTVGSFFRRLKDQQKKEDTRGIVYKIKCNDCAAVYIGQTASRLKKNRTGRRLFWRINNAKIIVYYV